MKGRAVFLAISLFFGLSLACSLGQSAYSRLYTQAKAQKAKLQYAEAIGTLGELIALADQQSDHYWLFYAHRNLGKVYEDLNNYNKTQEHYLVTLDSFGKIIPGRTGLSNNDSLFERCLLVGLIEKNYYYRGHLALSSVYHEKMKTILKQIVLSYEGETYELDNFKKPEKTPAKYFTQVFRMWWMHSWHLKSRGDVLESVVVLRKALSVSESMQADLNYVGMDYRLKLRNQLALMLSHLGYIEEAIEQQQKIILEAKKAHAGAYHIAVMNRAQGMAKHHGPDEKYLKNAKATYDFYLKLKGLDRFPMMERIVVKMAYAMNRDGLAIEKIEKLLDLELGKGGEFWADYLTRDRLMMKRQKGQLEGMDDDFVDLLQSLRDKGNKTGEPVVYSEYASYLDDVGKLDKAILMLHESIEQTAKYGWHLHLPRLLMKQAAFYCKAGNLPMAEKMWLRIDQVLKDHDDFPAYRLLEVYVGRIKYYHKTGKIDLAKKTYADAFRFIRENEIPEFRKKPFEAIDLTTVYVEAKTEEEERASYDAIDLQPKKLTTQILKGESAKGRFVLSNVSAQNIRGTLKIAGSSTSHEWNAQSGRLFLEVVEAAEDKVVSIDMELDSGDQIEIHLLLVSKAAAGVVAMDISWEDSSGSKQQSAWDVSAGDSAHDFAIVDRNITDANPFYGIPLYHEIYYRNKDQQSMVLDLRVVTSTDLYVELVDAKSGKVFAVDNQSNGSFLDEGDWFSRNDNLNNFPDLTLSADKDVYPLELRVYTNTLKYTKDLPDHTLDIELQYRLDDEWISFVNNKIIFRK